MYLEVHVQWVHHSHYLYSMYRWTIRGVGREAILQFLRSDSNLSTTCCRSRTRNIPLPWTALTHRELV